MTAPARPWITVRYGACEACGTQALLHRATPPYGKTGPLFACPECEAAWEAGDA